jgi:hypothetical protein
MRIVVHNEHLRQSGLLFFLVVAAMVVGARWLSPLLPFWCVCVCARSRLQRFLLFLLTDLALLIHPIPLRFTTAAVVHHGKDGRRTHEQQTVRIHLWLGVEPPHSRLRTADSAALFIVVVVATFPVEVMVDDVRGSWFMRVGVVSRQEQTSARW